MALAMTAYWAAPAAAQLLYGSLTGLVEDASGGSVPNSSISITNKGTGQTYEAKSDEAGRYTIQNILPGEYDVKIVASGFRPETVKSVRITSGFVSRENAKLEVGSLNESISVQAETTALQTDKSDTHTALNSQQISLRRSCSCSIV